MKKKLSGFLSLALALLMLLSACGTGAKTEGDADGAVHVSAAVSNEPETFDAVTTTDTMSYNVIVQTMETLINMSPEYELEPGLAESWEQVDDVTYRFHLRQGVKFQNGEEMKASDAVFSLKRFTDSTYMSKFSASIDPEGFVVEDDYTFTMQLKYPNADILAIMTFPPTVIISEKEFEAKNGDFSRDPSGMGTGPFKFVEWKSGEQITLERNENYWDGVPEIETLTFKVIQDPSTRVIELETGAVDFIYFVPCSYLESLKANDSLVVSQYAGTTTTAFLPKVVNEPFTDIRVRQALSYAIDRETLVSVVFGEGAQPMECVVPYGFSGYEEGMTYPYDKEKAISLLKEAGYDENNPVSFEVWIHDNSEYQKALEIIQSMWDEVGVHIEIKVLEAAAMSAAMAANEQPTTLGAVGSANGLSVDILSDYLARNIPPEGNGNRTNYNNPEYDALIDQAIKESDPEKRAEIFKQCQEILLENAICIPVFCKDIIFAQSNKLEGVELLPLNRAYFKDATIVN